MWSKHTRIGRYHPASNGMLELMHCTLKAALACHAESWMTILPSVLLGLHTVLKEDLGCCFVQLDYGDQLKIPGAVFSHSSHYSLSVQTYAIFLREDLSKYEFVCIKDDTARPPLSPPFMEKITDSADQTFVVEKKNVKHETMSGA
ncbi:uncharacterized protein LOC126298101 [Schistocerca gregaria]|uniref:uncharacterized protein LOC126298101 n=1 Tax=Schistocerca gregaria TaxID=7010 RepID=UPI00211EF03F|nr:uncharacterized protein LOC126298101 [Schistocerca gregaria]